VNDAQGSLVQGRTRWRRFAAVVLPAVAATGAIVFGMANGAIAASVNVSGQPFKVSAEELDGNGFVQYGGFAKSGENTQTPVAMSGIRHATLYKLCQSVRVPNLPFSMVIKAGERRDNQAEADDLLIAMNDLKGDATFNNISIGVDAGTLSAGAPGLADRGIPGQFGQKSDHVNIKNLQQTALSTSAGTFKLNGMHLYLSVVSPGQNPEECF
jgi:Family of unknown function (DUF6230)